MLFDLKRRRGASAAGAGRRAKAARDSRVPASERFKAFAPLNGQTLVLPASNIGIIWSPKCACTKVVLWYFKLTGLLHAAMFYHPWPHVYRMQVFYHSREYGNWVRTADWKNFSWYQFCRDPVKRLLSSYRHNLGHGHADERISRALGRTVSCQQGYSLNDFLTYLDRQDLAGRCDPHVRLQVQEISDSVPVKVINIDDVDMLVEMNAIERAHGLPVTDFSEIAAFARDERRRAKVAAHEQFSPDRILSKADARGNWPLEAATLDADTTERIKRLYARDMAFIYGQAEGSTRTA